MLHTLLTLTTSLSNPNYSLNWDTLKPVQVAQVNPRTQARFGVSSFYYGGDPLALEAMAPSTLYPVGTVLLITNLDTGLVVRVTVTRSVSYFHTPRTLDISLAAAREIKATRAGGRNPFPVLIRVVSMPNS